MRHCAGTNAGGSQLPKRAPSRKILRLDTVDVNRLTEPVGYLTIDEVQRIDEALTLVLDL